MCPRPPRSCRLAEYSSFFFFSWFSAISKYVLCFVEIFGTSSRATRCEGTGAAHISAVIACLSCRRFSSFLLRRCSFESLSCLRASLAASARIAALLFLLLAVSNFLAFCLLPTILGLTKPFRLFCQCEKKKQTKETCQISRYRKKPTCSTSLRSCGGEK